MKARLIGAAALAVCATMNPASVADSPKQPAEAELRLAAEEPPRGRFRDERYLLTPRTTAWRPLASTSESVWLEGPSASPAPLGTADRPTGMIDEVLFREDGAWRFPAIRASGFVPRGAGLTDWSGLAITSTVGE